MESLLIVVTVISLLLAITMSVVAWTLLKAERQRSAARVEALEALAFSIEPEPEVQAPVPARPADAAEETPAATVLAAAEIDLAPELPDWDAVIRGHAREPGDSLNAPTTRTRARAALPEAMFGAEAASNAGTRRLLAVAAIGLIVAAGYATASAMRSPEVVAAMTVSAPPTTKTDQPLPLELLSLKHASEADGSFVVSGFVQNPPGGRRLTNVEAVVYLFDSKDQYFMTGRAPLEASDMRGGTDSAFQVVVPSVSNVGRYRLGFRQPDGTVVAHLDRRGNFPEGSTETVTGADGTADDVRPAGGMR